MLQNKHVDGFAAFLVLRVLESCQKHKHKETTAFLRWGVTEPMAATKHPKATAATAWTASPPATERSKSSSTSLRCWFQVLSTFNQNKRFTGASWSHGSLSIIESLSIIGHGIQVFGLNNWGMACPGLRE